MSPCGREPPGSLKFNVDGSARGKPGPAGIGGVLKDCMAVTKAVFSRAIGVADSNVAELLAVRDTEDFRCIQMGFLSQVNHRK